MRILLLDNYDSFTYNLLHYAEQFVDEVVVLRNDAISVADVAQFDAVILSPGPGLPKDAGIMPQLIKTYATTKPILGVCLGLQAIGEAFGAQLINLQQPLHGVAEPTVILDPNEPMFQGFPRNMLTGRYHSWVIDTASVPDQFRITAVDQQANVMALRHRTFPLCGVQFHPESLLTPNGLDMIRHWVIDSEAHFQNNKR